MPRIITPPVLGTINANIVLVATVKELRSRDASHYTLILLRGVGKSNRAVAVGRSLPPALDAKE